MGAKFSFYFSCERCGRIWMHFDRYSMAASLPIHCAYILQYGHECNECSYRGYISNSIQVNIQFTIYNKRGENQFIFSFIQRTRAMAVFTSLMFGRLGCILSVITTALLLDTHCEVVFHLSASILIGRNPKKKKRSLLKCNLFCGEFFLQL